MLLTQEKLTEIIELSQKVLATSQSRFGENDNVVSDHDLSQQIVAEMITPSLPSQKLQKVLKQLSSDELCELQALIWLGRDTSESFDSSDDKSFEQLLKEAKINYSEHDVDQYIMPKQQVLAKYLTRGIELVRNS